MVRVLTVLVVIQALGVPLTSAAQAPVPAPAAAGAESVPVLPETITRNPGGAVTVRAVRLEGTLDEAVYERVRPASGFIQIEPQPGEPATDQTEVWVMFDGDNVYVAVRCFDTDMDIVATELRRDNTTIWLGDDAVSISFDTFLDRRNTVQFMMNPLGGRMDGQTTNESQWNGDWNAVWDVAVGRFDRGWTTKFSIPFKSLRYGPGAEQRWDFNMLRLSRSANEISFLTEMPPARGQSAFHMALSGRGEPDLRHLPAVIGFLGYDPRPQPTDVGERLARLRKSRGLSQKDLAGQLGIDPSTLAKWEVGRRAPQGTCLVKVEALFCEWENPRKDTVNGEGH